MKTIRLAVIFAAGAVLAAVPSGAQDYQFNSGSPDGLIATASRPDSTGRIEIESADDFIIAAPTRLTHSTFTGLITGGATSADIGNVRVEIYRVFPNDSNNPPDGRVTTRVNSPSDVALLSRDALTAGLHFHASALSGNFAAANSVLNGINPIPGEFTGGEGPVTGVETLFDVSFDVPVDLPADHYFFVPQVQVNNPNGEFMWLSAPKPIVPPGTPFTPDLQTWIRNGNLAPDWLRVGTDITHQGPFNGAFSLTGATTPTIPEPSSLLLLLSAGLPAIGTLRRRKA
ncbi:MAG TPA: PEP-CTERM sorting domain-containing protein [Armatimonadota bacterium]|jgi:hypothetical protein